MDVYGFQEKELKVKVSGVNEISIEGVSEESKNGSTSKHSFQRTFQLPDCIDVDRAVTALSNEGILTITVPKKVRRMKNLWSRMLDGGNFEKIFNIAFSFLFRINSFYKVGKHRHLHPR